MSRQAARLIEVCPEVAITVDGDTFSLKFALPGRPDNHIEASFNLLPGIGTAIVAAMTDPVRQKAAENLGTVLAWVLSHVGTITSQLIAEPAEACSSIDSFGSGVAEIIGQFQELQEKRGGRCSND